MTATVRAPKSRRSKYGAHKTQYNGRMYHSAAEARHAMELDILAKAGKILGWIPQPVKRIEVNGILICKMILDFEVKLALGRYYYDEVKGHETAVYKLKLKLLKACYPDIDLRIVRA